MRANAWLCLPTLGTRSILSPLAFGAVAAGGRGTAGLARVGTGAGMGEETIHPLLLYLGCGLGAAGLAVSMPRRGTSLAVVGALLGAVALGLVFLGLGLAAPLGSLPNAWFYAFAVLGLGSGLRMITHPRPVYAALYFVMTIVSSAGLFVLLSAEFMAFALIIIYAGAILITYLFVIMLATQAPSEEESDRQSEYDASAREPVAAAAIGFVLLAVLTTVLFRGSGGITPAGSDANPASALVDLPGKIESELLDRGLIETGERVLVDASGAAAFDPEAMTAVVAGPEGAERTVSVPVTMAGSNPELVGLNLLAEHPMTIEIAGVILLMAMLGATVLARKQVDIEEEAKARQARRLHVDDVAGGTV